VRGAAELELDDAQASSAGPVTDLLKAKSIRLEMSIEHNRPFVDLNPQDAVLHKFASDCAAKLGIGASPAKTASPQPGTSSPLQR
jgi:hypothetical protein